MIASFTESALFPLAIIAGVLVVFPIFWVGIVRLLGMLSGWTALGKQHATDAPLPEPVHSMQWCRFGWIEYRLVVHFALDADALWIDILGLFRSGHPRLRIPRAEVVDVGPGRFGFVAHHRLELPGGTVVALPKAVWEQRPPAWREIATRHAAE